MGLVLVVALIWFVLSCKANGKRGRREDREASGSGRYRNRDPEANYKQSEMSGLGEFQGISTNDDDDDDDEEE